MIKDEQGHLLTELGEVKQRWRQYFDTLYNDPNAVNIDYNEKHFSSHSNTRDNEEILNNMSKIEEAIKRAKCRKAPGVHDITVKELEKATIKSSGTEVLLRFFREIWEHEVIITE